MPYLEPLPQWESPGVEPPAQLKSEGWRYTQRPPASYFDWFFFTVYFALKEIQEQAIHQERIVNSTSTADATKVASANAVKSAFDRAVSGESAAKTYADAKIAALVDSAPGTLDTLNELAAALNDDPNFATTITNLIATKIATSEKGVASGVATLGTDGKVPLNQLPDGTASAKGVLQLNNTVTSTSTTQAATANAVKTAMDRADAAFQQANDIKTKWASVVGSPLLSTDTQAQLESKTLNIKNTIVAHLTSKSVTAANTESLTALVNKLIALNP